MEVRSGCYAFLSPSFASFQHAIHSCQYSLASSKRVVLPILTRKRSKVQKNTHLSYKAQRFALKDEYWESCQLPSLQPWHRLHIDLAALIVRKAQSLEPW